ncbi:MAG: arylsulfatase [Planctomycetota bacterium]|jgi:arylsulfatase A-like enzyme
MIRQSPLRFSTRPTFLPLVALVVFTATCGLYAGAAERPNVIVVITDDQGYGDVAAHGNTMIQTPNLDRLYAESVRLTDFHVDPTCSPTRSALMSGRYSTRTGVWHTIMGRSLMSPHEVTLAEVFRAGGYRTGMFGKWHLGDNFPCRPQDQGFDETFYHGGGGVGQGPDYWGNDYFDDVYFRNGKPEEAAGYCTDVWFQNALAFIEKNKDRPFFVYLSTNAPHGPYLVADKYWKPYAEKGVPDTMAHFYGMITNIDENMGKLTARLEAWDLEENTILVFMTDNGSAAGWRARGKGTWQGFNAGMRAGKGSEYDGGHRVPFFIRWPAGKIGGGRDVGQLSAHVDVLPPEKWRKCAVMTERWRLVNGKELYDVKTDPGQQSDLAAKSPQVVAELRTAYDGWWESLSPVFDDCVFLGIGSEAEPVTRLVAHDWHPPSQGESPWNQGHVRSGHVGNGYWAIEVMRAGEYEFELRRWPDHVDESIEATHARLRIGDVEADQPVPAGATKTTFTVKLKPGKTRLQTWLTTPDGKTRGAYFVYIRRVG